MKVPIRYGKKAQSRDYTYTMVFARSCSEPKKLGTGIVVPARAECRAPEHLLQEARHLWAAERNSSEIGDICAGWGRVCVLQNPNGAVPEPILTAWQEKAAAEYASHGALPTAEGESPVLDTATGCALLDWPTDVKTNEPLSDIDLLLMTATKPDLDGGQYPTSKQIADAWLTDTKANVMYFHNNRYFGITTFEDDAIGAFLRGESLKSTLPHSSPEGPQ